MPFSLWGLDEKGGGLIRVVERQAMRCGSLPLEYYGMPRACSSRAALTALLLLASPASAFPQSAFAGQSALAGETIRIVRTTGSIVVDGDLSDDGWRSTTRVDTWYETNPGDNIEPSVGNVAFLAYDNRFFYAGFDFADPDPRSIRAPLGDRDNVPSFTDYGGVILDTRGDGKSAMMMLANARGVQYDAITDDSSGEDNSPDFFWDVATRITDRG